MSFSYVQVKQQISNMEEVLSYLVDKYEEDTPDISAGDLMDSVKMQIVMLYDMQKDLEDWQTLAIWELGGTFYSIIASTLLNKIQFMQGAFRSRAADPYNDTLIWSGGLKDFIRPITEQSEAIKALYGEL